MKNIIWIITVVLVLISCDNDEVIHIKSGALISNITVISADSNKVNSYTGYVVIDGDKIVYVNKNVPSIIGDYENIIGKGKFVIPGLIDSHVHLANTAGLNGQLKNKYPAHLEIQSFEKHRSI